MRRSRTGVLLLILQMIYFKRYRTFRRCAIAILAIVVFAILSAFLLRGWIRMTFEPRLVGVFVSHHVAAVESSESNNIRSLLPALSGPVVNYHNCDLEWAAKMAATINCYATSEQVSSTQKVGISLETLRGIPSELQRAGWSRPVGDAPSESSDSSLTDVEMSYARDVDKHMTCTLNFSAYRMNSVGSEFDHASYLLTCVRELKLF